MNKLAVIVFLVLSFLTPSLCFSQQKTVVLSGGPELEAFMKKAGEVFTGQTGIKVYIVKGNPGRSGITIGFNDISKEKKKAAFSYIIGYDSQVVVVNGDNSLESLDSEAVSFIFTGKISNWGTLGGAEGDIVVVEHERTSRYQAIFNTLFLIDNENESSFFIESLSEVQRVLLVAGDPRAIGYISHSTARRAMEERYSLKILEVENFTASQKELLFNSHLLSRELFISTRTVPMGASKVFIDFMTGPEGRKLTEQFHYLSAGQ